MPGSTGPEDPRTGGLGQSAFSENKKFRVCDQRCDAAFRPRMSAPHPEPPALSTAAPAFASSDLKSQSWNGVTTSEGLRNLRKGVYLSSVSAIKQIR